MVGNEGLTGSIAVIGRQNRDFPSRERGDPGSEEGGEENQTQAHRRQRDSVMGSGRLDRRSTNPMMIT